MYSLMGAGIYGGSGLNPVVSAHLWKMYVIPRVIYGLEVLSCTLSDVQSLERLQRDMLRRQSLPRSTATAAVNCLLGIRPIEQELDLRRFTLLCSVLYTNGTLEQDIAMRQIAVKDSDNNSWFLSATNSCICTIFLTYIFCSNSSVVKYPVSRRSRPKSTAS